MRMLVCHEMRTVDVRVSGPEFLTAVPEPKSLIFSSSVSKKMFW